MLTHLKISNLALVDTLVWSLGGGLVSVTGETGAGKSVIVGALKLMLGERADKSIIRTGEEKCQVEAVFELSNITSIECITHLLDAAGIEQEEGMLIIKRVVSQKSNKQFINNSPATLSLLKQIGEHLVDLHGPHEHQSLHSNDRQLSMLDSYASAGKENVNYRETWRAWSDKVAELHHLKESDQASMQAIDLLRFQVDEIDAANLRPEEESEVVEKHKRFSNSSQLVENSSHVASIINSQIASPLADAQRFVRELERLDPKVKDLLSGFDSAVIEIQELGISIEEYANTLVMDPEEFQMLEERIQTFEQLKRKYGATLEDVLVHADEARDSLAKIENRDEHIERLEKEVEDLKFLLDEKAEKLTKKRTKKAPALSSVIAQHLKDLGFLQAEFEISIKLHEDPQSSGYEGVDFLFGPNPGEPLKPLRQIGSSGEISRVMLAVKSALASQDHTPLMVFDEIDANVGGSIARAVGEKMAALGGEHQVIAITHFPQVAAVANQHFLVEKQVESGRTSSKLNEVSGEERIQELVRMLGGGEGAQARAMAESLLK